MDCYRAWIAIDWEFAENYHGGVEGDLPSEALSHLCSMASSPASRMWCRLLKGEYPGEGWGVGCIVLHGQCVGERVWCRLLKGEYPGERWDRWCMGVHGRCRVLNERCRVLTDQCLVESGGGVMHVQKLGAVRNRCMVLTFVTWASHSSCTSEEYASHCLNSITLCRLCSQRTPLRCSKCCGTRPTKTTASS